MMNLEELKNRFGNITVHVIYIKAGAMLFATVIFMLWTYQLTGRIEKQAKAKKMELTTFTVMREEYLQERMKIVPLEKRLFLALSQESPGAVVEGIGGQIGIKKNIVAFKPVEEKIEKGYIQNGVEIKIEGITLNQIANLVYRIGNYKNLLIIKEFRIKAQFNNPELFDMTMRITLMSRQHE